MLDLPYVLSKGEQGIPSSGHQAGERCYSAYNPLPAGHGFVVGKDLVSQLVDKLIKTQVNLVKRKRGGEGSVVPVWINRRNVGSWECTRAD